METLVVSRVLRHKDVRKLDVEGTLSPLPFFEIRIMISVKQVRDLVNQRIEDTDIFVVDISVSVANAIRVVIDSDTNLSINKCIEISRQVEHNLDREEEDFSLEVTSFGLTEPLQMQRQYVKNIDRILKVKLLDDRQVKGKLTKVDDKAIYLERTLTKKEAKEGLESLLIVEFEEIKQAKIEISFK